MLWCLVYICVKKIVYLMPVFLSLLQIVCYIYFTRIIAILIKFIVPFQWKWLYQVGVHLCFVKR